MINQFILIYACATTEATTPHLIITTIILSKGFKICSQLDISTLTIMFFRFYSKMAEAHVMLMIDKGEYINRNLSLLI